MGKKAKNEPAAVQETAADNDSSEKVQDTTVEAETQSSDSVEQDPMKSEQKTVLVICSYPG